MGGGKWAYPKGMARLARTEPLHAKRCSQAENEWGADVCRNLDAVRRLVAGSGALEAQHGDVPGVRRPALLSCTAFGTRLAAHDSYCTSSALGIHGRSAVHQSTVQS